MGMDGLFSIFPPEDFTLLCVILGLPLLGAFVNGVFGKRLGKEAVSLMALVAVGGSFMASCAAFFMLMQRQTETEAARFVWHGWKWLDISGNGDFQIPIEIAFSVDALSGGMALIVTGVGFLIHLYSTEYMAEDDGFHRFFAYLNLFIFSMLVLILGDNLPVLFIGWEGVGMCSYLLIGFWFTEEANAVAGKKAFVTNRIGDFGLLVAMALLVWHVGALDWQGIEAGANNLLTPIKIYPLGNGVPAWLPDFIRGPLTPEDPRGVRVTAATLVGFALFLGCAGKSAQLPLYVWLPDAMAGPTPVSALIHAATMVTAGVYLCCRMAAVFVLSPATMATIAIVGLATALLAASIAFAQNDIKKVLAYSTVSQLGYMFIGIGVGAFATGFFHVITHAFFKACLFLGAGSVIHAMHARIHDVDRSQDMRNMGGMRNFMPITHLTFLASCLAIAGLPLTSGFFSKDEILFKAYTSTIATPQVSDGEWIDRSTQVTWPAMQAWTPPEDLGRWIYTLALLGAVMTAFYMFRLYFRVFWGEFRGWTIVRGWVAPAGGHHGHDDHEHDSDEPLDGPKPHESALQITVPLVVLGVLAIFAGGLNAHAFFHSHLFDDWVAPVLATASSSVGEIEGAKEMMMPLLLPGIGAFAIGVGGAYWVYVMQRGEPAASFVEKVPWLHRIVYEKWRVDELYEETFIGAVDTLGDMAVWVDQYVVDAVVARVTSFAVAASGTILRTMQTGRVHAYGAVMVAGLGALGWFFIAPQAVVTVLADDDSGVYSVTASPGLGYQYRWDEDGDGELDSDDFGDKARVDVQLGRSEVRLVQVEVKNALGFRSIEQIGLFRPQRDGASDGLAGAAQEAKEAADSAAKSQKALQDIQRVLQQAGGNLPGAGKQPAPKPVGGAP